MLRPHPRLRRNVRKQPTLIGKYPSHASLRRFVIEKLNQQILAMARSFFSKLLEKFSQHCQIDCDGSCIFNRRRQPTNRAGNKGEYLKAIAAAYESGFAFHQKAVQESEMLPAWVLHPNYWGRSNIR